LQYRAVLQKWGFDDALKDGREHGERKGADERRVHVDPWRDGLSAA
jgi:hypothetical protein